MPYPIPEEEETGAADAEIEEMQRKVLEMEEEAERLKALTEDSRQ